jgi:hypothetical protein
MHNMFALDDGDAVVGEQRADDDEQQERRAARLQREEVELLAVVVPASAVVCRTAVGVSRRTSAIMFVLCCNMSCCVATCRTALEHVALPRVVSPYGHGPVLRPWSPTECPAAPLGVVHHMPRRRELT